MKKKGLMILIASLCVATLSSCNNLRKGYGEIFTNDKIKSNDEDSDEYVTENENDDDNNNNDKVLTGYHKISWLNEDGSEIRTSTIKDGKTPSYVWATPTKNGGSNYGYDFDGWDPAFAPVYEDTSYTAKFVKYFNTIKVNWRREDGSVFRTESFARGSTIVAAVAPEKADQGSIKYTFDYYEDDQYGRIPTEPINGRIFEYNFKAHYKEKGHTIVFENYDKSTIKEITGVINNSKLSDSKYYSQFPSSYEMSQKGNNRKNGRYSYQFVGWSLGSKEKENDPSEDTTTGLIPVDSREGQTPDYITNLSTINVTNDIVLHAEYKLVANTYNVNFFGKNASDKLGTIESVNYGDTVIFEGHGFSNPSSFTGTDIEGKTDTFTWEGGFKYKNGTTWVKGYKVIKGNTDYFADYQGFQEREESSCTFSSDSSSFTFVIEIAYPNKFTEVNDLRTIHLQYAIGDNAWSDYTIGTYLNIPQYTKLYLRGTGNNVFGTNVFDTSVYYHLKLSGSNVKWKGYMDCLINYKDVANGKVPTWPSCAFIRFAKDQTALVEGPSLLTNNITYAALHETFSGCTNLKNLGNMEINYCKSGGLLKTFLNCTSLIDSPTFNISNCESEAFYEMFSGCTSIKKINGTFNLTSVPQFCFDGFFKSCTSLIDPPKFTINGTIEQDGLNAMYAWCSSLTNPNITGNITNIKNWGCNAMFYYCTSLQEPVFIFNATSIGRYGMSSLYGYCSKIKISTTCHDAYTKKIRLPNQSGNGYVDSYGLDNVIYGTGGEYTGESSSPHTISKDTDYYYVPASV